MCETGGVDIMGYHRGYGIFLDNIKRVETIFFFICNFVVLHSDMVVACSAFRFRHTSLPSLTYLSFGSIPFNSASTYVWSFHTPRM